MTIPLYAYHCVCSTFLLCTPYALTSLPRRAPPALDDAFILPLPQSSDSNPQDTDAGTATSQDPQILPSTLSDSLIPSHNLIIIRREDGFERRRVYRCGRCELAVGYEIEPAEDKGSEAAGHEEGKDGRTRWRGRRLYLMDGLRESKELEEVVKKKEEEIKSGDTDGKAETGVAMG